MAFGLSGAAIGGIAAGVGSIAGGIIGGNASKGAAKQQAKAAREATALQRAQWQQTQANLKPYLDLGTSAINPLLSAMGYMPTKPGEQLSRDQIYQQLLPQYTHAGNPSGGPQTETGPSWMHGFVSRVAGSQQGSQGGVDYAGLNAAVDDAMRRQQAASYGNWQLDPNNILNQQFGAPTAEQAAQTPGYQFTLDQGLRAVQNSASARGLGTSGAAMRGAADYTTGLANTTYNDVFNRALQTFNTNYGSAANRVNRLATLVGNGQNAAATNGALGAQSMNSIGDTLMQGANAAAAGRVGAANALSAGINGVGSSAMLYGLMQNNAGGQPAGTQAPAPVVDRSFV